MEDGEPSREYARRLRPGCLVMVHQDDATDLRPVANRYSTQYEIAFIDLGHAPSLEVRTVSAFFLRALSVILENSEQSCFVVARGLAGVIVKTALVLATLDGTSRLDLTRVFSLIFIRTKHRSSQSTRRSSASEVVFEQAMSQHVSVLNPSHLNAINTQFQLRVAPAKLIICVCLDSNLARDEEAQFMFTTGVESEQVYGSKLQADDIDLMIDEGIASSLTAARYPAVRGRLSTFFRPTRPVPAWFQANSWRLVLIFWSVVCINYTQSIRSALQNVQSIFVVMSFALSSLAFFFTLMVSTTVRSLSWHRLALGFGIFGAVLSLYSIIARADLVSLLIAGVPLSLTAATIVPGQITMLSKMYRRKRRHRRAAGDTVRITDGQSFRLHAFPASVGVVGEGAIPQRREFDLESDPT